MIDIHSHILPNIDDGARTTQEAITMLKMAVDNGISTQVLTPHLLQPRFQTSAENITESFYRFRDTVEKEGLPLELKLGSEVRVCSQLLSKTLLGQIPTLGAYQQKRCLLLEFSRRELPIGIDNVVRWLSSQGYQIIIAHPERITPFLRDHNKLVELIHLGCMTQITASSLTGRFGPEVQKYTELLLTNNQANFMASDAHRAKGRVPDLYKGYIKAKGLIGQKRAEHMVLELPNQIINPCALN